MLLFHWYWPSSTALPTRESLLARVVRIYAESARAVVAKVPFALLGYIKCDGMEE